MRRQLQRAGATLALVLMVSSAAGAQTLAAAATAAGAAAGGTSTYKVRESASKHLGWAGVGTLVLGLALVAPMGEEYTILGDTYCVSYDGHDVWSGGCGAEAGPAKVGAALVGVGAGLMWLGFRKVTKTKTAHWSVGPSVSQSHLGGQVAIRW